MEIACNEISQFHINGYIGSILVLSTMNGTTVCTVCAQDSGSVRLKAIKNLPFTATQWIAKTIAAPNGSTSVTTQQIDIARSSDGLVQREIHEASTGSARVLGRPSVIVSVLNNDARTASSVFHNARGITSVKTPQIKNATADATKNQSSHMSAGINLGTSEMGSLKAIGHRTTYTAQGWDTADKPIAMTSEIWYSLDLNFVLKSSIVDSAKNSVVTVVTNIKRVEPDPSLFASVVDLTK